MTGAILEEDGERSVLHSGAPMKAPEVRIEEDLADSWACAPPARTTW